MEYNPFDKEQPICYSGCSIYRKDYQCLSPYQWLRSQTIHILSKLIEEKYQVPNTKVLDPFIASMLTFLDDEEFLQSLRKQNLFDYDYLLIPMNTQINNEGDGNHWYLLVFDKIKCRLIVYDSLLNQAYANTQVIKDRLQKMGKMFKGCQFDISIQIEKTTNKQNNSYDCGIFTIGNIEWILKRLKKNPNLDVQSVLDQFQCSRAVYKKFLLDFLSSQTQLT